MSEAFAATLAEIVFEYFKKLKSSCLAVFLENWPSKPFEIRRVSQCLLPVLSYLPKVKVHENDPSAEVVKAFKEYAKHLYWGQTYTAEVFGDAFLHSYGWTEIIGLRGPVASNDVACGFLLLGPDTEYPRHSHEAEEVYVALSSQALWIKGNGEWTLRQRGIPIYHEPWIAHGMRTGSEPLLALYLWHGKYLDQKSHIE